MTILDFKNFGDLDELKNAVIIIKLFLKDGLLISADVQ